MAQTVDGKRPGDAIEVHASNIGQAAKDVGRAVQDQQYKAGQVMVDTTDSAGKKIYDAGVSIQENARDAGQAIRESRPEAHDAGFGHAVLDLGYAAKEKASDIVHSVVDNVSSLLPAMPSLGLSRSSDAPAYRDQPVSTGAGQTARQLGFVAEDLGREAKWTAKEEASRESGEIAKELSWAKDKANEAGRDASWAAKDASNSIAQTASNLGHAAADKASSLAHSVADLGHTAKDKAVDFSYAAKDKAVDLGHAAKEKAGEVAHTVADYGQVAKDKASHMAHTVVNLDDKITENKARALGRDLPARDLPELRRDAELNPDYLRNDFIVSHDHVSGRAKSPDVSMRQEAEYVSDRIQDKASDLAHTAKEYAHTAKDTLQETASSAAHSASTFSERAKEKAEEAALECDKAYLEHA